MGLFGFGKETKVEKLVKTLTNAYRQSHERYTSMEKLAELGTPEAIDGLLKRFEFRIEASITDDDEKRTCFEHLVHLGDRSIAPIRRYIEVSENVYWPLRALRDIAGVEVAVDHLLGALDRATGRDIRVNEHRVQLVSNLRDFQHPNARDRLLRLADDPDEDVRIQAIDCLMAYGEEVAVDAVVRRLLHPEETPRLKAVVLEQLIDHGWSLARWRDELSVEGVLPMPYALGPDGVPRRET